MSNSIRKQYIESRFLSFLGRQTLRNVFQLTRVINPGAAEVITKATSESIIIRNIINMICAAFSALDEEFHIRHRFFIPSHLTEPYLQPTYKHFLVNGDLRLNKNLNFDWGAFEALGGAKANEVQGLIIMGDLTIDGDLLNNDIDSGPLLMVRGNLVANNLRSGGGSIIIGRDASIRDIVFGNYNHGELHIQNDLYAGLLVMRDHVFGARRIHASHTVSDDTDLDPDSDDGVENLRLINAHLEVKIDDVDMLETYLKENTSVLKTSSRNTYSPKPSVWPTTAEQVVDYLRTQKRVYGGDIPPEFHQDRKFMLRLCAMHADVFDGLKNRWHLSPDFMAAAIHAGNKNVTSYLKHVEDPLMRQQLLDQINQP
jgi:hypothetical protein